MNRIYKYTDEELIGELHNRKRKNYFTFSLDYKDLGMLNSIIEAFENSTWAERELMYKKVCNEK